MIEILVKRGTSHHLSEQNPVLDSGEPCLEVDTGRIKYGDGVTPWNLLSYSSSDEISFGTNNETAGIDAFAAGGSENLASGNSAVSLGGKHNWADGVKSAVLGGEFNEASSVGAIVAGGSNNVAAGDSSAALGGFGNIAEGTNSISMGFGAKATKESQLAMSSGSFAVQGDAQSSVYHLRAVTQDGTPTRMYINGTSGNLTLEPGASWLFEIMVSASDGSPASAVFGSSSSSEIRSSSGAWFIEGVVSRDFSGNSNLRHRSSSMGLSDLWGQVGPAISSDGQSLIITVTGLQGQVIRWAATVTTTEVIAEEPLVSDMFVEIAGGSAISSMEVTVDGNQMQPAFNPAITDYVVHSNLDFYSVAEAGYSVVINGGPAISGTAGVNKALRIKHGVQDYFVRILPSDFPNIIEVQTKTSQYVPGYYLISHIGAGPYFAVLDGNGVPVWYTYSDDSLCGVISLHTGSEPNKFITNGYTNNCPRWDIQIGLNSVTAKPYTMINPDTRGGMHTWEIHESHSIRGPESRKGNVIYESYDNTGFYIQEQNPQGQIVWEWWSDDYFNTSYADYFHLNSIDVHPVTGDILLSCRHNSAVVAIDYETKGIIWVVEGDSCCNGAGNLFSVAKPNMTANTKWLDPYSEPTVQGYSQYNGTVCQHDARWVTDILPVTSGNMIVSVFDNQSCTGRPARGVVYEIDLVNDRAVFRSHVYSSNGGSPYQGSFNLVKELDDSFSHVCCFPEQNPNLVEFKGGADGIGTQEVVLAMQMSVTAPYRVIKVRSDFLNINYMRTSAGRVPTII